MLHGDVAPRNALFCDKDGKVFGSISSLLPFSRMMAVKNLRVVISRGTSMEKAGSLRMMNIISKSPTMSMKKTVYNHHWYLSIASVSASSRSLIIYGSALEFRS